LPNPDSGYQPCRRLIGDFNFIFQKVFINRRQGFQPLTGFFREFLLSVYPDSGFQPCRRLIGNFELNQ
jgi:hypothetical protein